MKKLFTLFLAIVVLTTAAAAFAENTATDTSSIPQQQQMPGGPMSAGHGPGHQPGVQVPNNQIPNGPAQNAHAPNRQVSGNQTSNAQIPAGQIPRNQIPNGQSPSGQTANGQAPSNEKPADVPELPGNGQPGSAPGMPGNGNQVMIDFDELVTSGVISQETCDKIMSYMEANRPTDPADMTSQSEESGKPQDPPATNGQAPSDASSVNVQPPEAPQINGLLKDLLDAEVITQEEYDAMAAAQTSTDN